MSDKGLKVVPTPDAKTAPDGKPGSKSSGGLKGAFARLRSNRKRMFLLVGLPAVALLIGIVIYLSGGRYISTDNAYVGAQKVLITPEISGRVTHIAVREGQHVNPGDELFMLDKVPFQLAVTQAKAKVASVTTAFNKLKTDLKSLNELADLAKQNSELKKRDVDRKVKLAASQAGSQADVDTAAAALVTARLQERFTEQQRDDTLNQLLGNPDLPLAQFPDYVQAEAALDNAQRDLTHTVLRAPISGTATQVDNIQLGRFVPAGTPILSVIDDAAPWVDANPKETDITYLRVGQKATLDIDSFPNHTFTGTVVAVSPGTGAQFSILPPQNATGNWVKVVQRVPVRIAFDKNEDTRLLRAGMSVNVDIDTGHSRIPFMSKPLDKTVAAK